MATLFLLREIPKTWLAFSMAVNGAASFEKAQPFIDKWEDRLITEFATGSEIDPSAIEPQVIPVSTEDEAALFRYASLQWSIPVSQGYGRRTRFLVRDQFNGKLIGIFALGDPVFNLRACDQIVGWNQAQRQDRLYNVFDAFVLGAVDPYRQLLGGKLVALSTVSETAIDFLDAKYSGTTTHIKGAAELPRPVLITTTSALGRSSIYNRLTMRDRKIFTSVGFTEGYGHFQFSDELFSRLALFVRVRRGGLIDSEMDQIGRSAHSESLWSRWDFEATFFATGCNARCFWLLWGSAGGRSSGAKRTR